MKSEQKTIPFLTSNIANIAAYLLPLLAIVIFDVDYFVFYAAFFLEICAYMVTCVIRVSRFTKSTKHIALAALFMSPGIIASALFTLIFVLLNFSNSQGQNAWIPSLVILVTLCLVIVNQVKVYKSKIGKGIDFYSKVNANYVWENTPEKDIVTEIGIVIGSLFKGYGFLIYNGIILVVVWVLSSIIVSLFISEAKDYALFSLLALKFTTDFFRVTLVAEKWDERNDDQLAENYVRQLCRHNDKKIVTRTDRSPRA